MLDSTIMSKSIHDTSFSFSRRFHWKIKKLEDEITSSAQEEQEEQDHDQQILTFNIPIQPLDPSPSIPTPTHNKKNFKHLRSALAVFTGKNRSHHHNHHPNNNIIGTLFGSRRGHVHLSFQIDSKANPLFLVELPMPTSYLVKEMASGLVRIALECDKKAQKKSYFKLLDEPIWRTYCNGKKCGYAMRKDCGENEWKVLEAVGPVTMGAGVLPAIGESEIGEAMYMRASFERVGGLKDSESFYMMNPDGHGGPELSIYLLRV
ncbi:protein MIZU-KUSSEI 1-like [Impatiens glandulifera]|uniref:protein MIZU-KUSSEI 1-like n=1 Tax=Impatiens glandulifera TaxID=253017 RepID=UPI001FB15144|nr:protein MIZU-KUSSEI 1-like [Impatiens glandulifera]